ncbi:centromere-associated protein E-like [Watersipora subatra]|uniref:centromere-associated protein E-like n=1 Tax=Watersipora subatra TaxID=2589382 RepID=UPI00355B566B
MTTNQDLWKTECRHDDACSSDSDSNVKATQITSTDLSDAASSADLVSDEDLDQANAQKNDPHRQRMLSTLSIDGFGRILPQNRQGVACQSTAMSFSAPTRHRYMVDTSVSQTPNSYRFSRTSNPDTTISIVPKVIFNPHKNAIDKEAIESLLNDVQERCQNSNEINQQLERKLHQKNQQLSQNCLLLAQSNESISKLQSQLDDERREKNDLRVKLKVIMQEKNELEVVREETRAEQENLQCEIKRIQEQLSEKRLLTTSLQQDIEELKSNKHMALEESELTIKQLQSEAKTSNEVIDNLKAELSGKSELIKKLQEACGKEEKSRKQIEKEVELVTQQGQSLLEQQSVMRTQYQEDLVAHQTRITVLEELLTNNEIQRKGAKEELHSQEQNTLRIESLLKENEKLHEQQINKMHSELQEVQQQVEEEKFKNQKLQQQVQLLKEESCKTEQELMLEKRRLTSASEQHAEQITTLQKEHAHDINEKQQKIDEAIESEKKSFDMLKNSFDKESINLKCRIAELEDKLEQRTKALSKVKDKLNEHAKSEEEAHSQVTKLQLTLEELKATNEVKIKLKEQEIKRLEEQISDLRKNIAEQENEMITEEQLRCTINQLTKENSELNQQVLAGREIISSLQNEYAATRQSANEISGIMRAKISKKESSKAILVAEHQRLERQYSLALSQKAEELLDLEHEVKTLQQQNAALMQMRESTVSTGNESVLKSLALIAKKHSSNQILAAENAKIKDDLRSANTWWNRDVHELQRRHAAQTNVLGEIERKMTALEIENSQLKQCTNNVDEQASSILTETSRESFKDQHLPKCENLLDHCKYELNNKESTINKLEASMLSAKGETNAALSKLEAASEREQIMKNGLEGKLSQNEMDVEKIHLDLTAAEVLLAKNDQEGAESIIKRSNVEMQVLLENIKSANQSATGTMRLASETHSSLIELHNQFSVTLDCVRRDAESASLRQKHDIEAMEKKHEQQLDKLYDNIQKQATEYTLQSQKLLSIETEKIKAEAKLQRAEENLRAINIEVANVKQALEVAEARKDMADNYVSELEEKLEKSRARISKLEGSVRVMKTDDSIIKERELAELRAKHEGSMATVEDIHRQTIDELNARLRNSEKENIKHLTEINSLHEKFDKESKNREEIYALHAEIQKLTIEKTELQDRFKEGLSTLRSDQELLLQECRNEKECLQCQLSELKAKYEAIYEQYEKYKAQALTLEADLQSIKAQNAEEVHKLKLLLQNSEQKVANLTESAEMEKQHLAKTLENTTRLEIEAVKLKNTIEKEVRQRQELSTAHNSEKQQIQQSLKEKASENKQLLADKKCLRLSIKSLGAEIQLLEEQGAMAKQDLEHAKSVCQLYRNKIEAVRRDSEPLLNNENISKLSQASISPVRHSVSSYTKHTSRMLETDGDLGVRTAELTNKVGELEHANKLLRRKLELAEEQQIESAKISIKHKSSLNTVVSQRDFHMNAYNALNQEHMRLQLDLKAQQMEQESTEEQLFRLKSAKDSIQKENDVLTRQIKEQKLKDLENDNKTSKETEQLRNYNKLITKMSEERKASLELEETQHLQAMKLQKEINIMKEQLEEAYDANRSLEKYIKNLKKSFIQLFEYEEATVVSRQNSRTLRRSTCMTSSKVKPDKE